MPQPHKRRSVVRTHHAVQVLIYARVKQPLKRLKTGQLNVPHPPTRPLLVKPEHKVAFRKMKPHQVVKQKQVRHPLPQHLKRTLQVRTRHPIHGRHAIRVRLIPQRAKLVRPHVPNQPNRRAYPDVQPHKTRLIKKVRQLPLDEPLQVHKRRRHHRKRSHWKPHKQPINRRNPKVVPRRLHQKPTLFELHQNDRKMKPPLPPPLKPQHKPLPFRKPYVHYAGNDPTPLYI